ncbi:RNA polymerase sigma factor [Leeuwenhoekiella sp. A16]|uniref:RNA polymerase sigma factor n=1 Tax=Leeuwenhoekiella sp. A16 TaxID=3141462 RepID=UPI003A812D52
MKINAAHDNHFQLLKQGTPTALALIYAKHSRLIFWIANDLIKDRFVVNSLVQDTFLKLWEHRDTIESPKHIFYFLRFVITRECTYYYARPKHKFQRSINSLENFGDYQNYMAGYDPVRDGEHLEAQKIQQQDFDRIKNILPFLSPARKHLIELCLKHGFRYKVIADLIGKSITETSNEVKRAIEDIKTIVNQGSSLAVDQRSAGEKKIKGKLTQEQEIVLQLRCEQHYSFTEIASTLSISEKQVHRAFMSAYRLSQHTHHQSQST